MTDKIKISYKDLSQKSTEELNKMIIKMRVHLQKSYSKKTLLDKGFNPIQERRNIARVQQILNERSKTK